MTLFPNGFFNLKYFRPWIIFIFFTFAGVFGFLVERNFAAVPLPADQKTSSVKSMAVKSTLEKFSADQTRTEDLTESELLAIKRKAQEQADQAVELLRTKFMSKYGFIYDFIGEHPTAQDCLEGRPSAIGWWSPIENAAMFSGLYLPAVCQKAAFTGSPSDRNHARDLARGLLLCGSVSQTPGFISRGVATDGKTFYPVGSDDQTASWFHGLYCYWRSDIPSEEEKKTIQKVLLSTADALEENNWYCPCSKPFEKENRGEFRHHSFLVVPCYLFILRACYDLSGKEIWLTRYKKAVREKIGPKGQTRGEICAGGFKQDENWLKNITQVFAWIYVKDQYALRELVRLETNETLRAQYQAGLDRCAEDAFSGMLEYRNFSNEDQKYFGNNWREGYPGWTKQKDVSEVMRAAGRPGNRKILGARKGYERRYMTNPLACAAIVALAERPQDRVEILKALGHYDFSKMNLSEFFYGVIAAWPH